MLPGGLAKRRVGLARRCQPELLCGRSRSDFEAPPSWASLEGWRWAWSLTGPGQQCPWPFQGPVGFVDIWHSP